MTAKRVSKEGKHQRHEWAIKQIDKGVGFSELASLVVETWGCSRRNARRVVSEAHKEWLDVAYGDEKLNQRDLFFSASPAWSARRVRRKSLVSLLLLLAASLSSTS